jgi:hydroxyacylglutathione hydrolase
MKIVTLPCSFDNYAYLIVCEQTGIAVVVDPAEFYPIYCALESSGTRLQAVLCSHHHADHIGGLGDLLEEYPDLMVYGHVREKKRISGLNNPLGDGDTIRIGNLVGKVLHTPGHTIGSLCYLFEDHLFTGDTLFGGGCGRLFEGTPRQMYEALNLTIKMLPPDTEVHFGHEYTVHNLKFAHFVEPGNIEIQKRLDLTTIQRANHQVSTPSTLASEMATNPFLRCGEKEIVRTVAEKFFTEDVTPLGVFTALRRQKDSF